MARLLIPEETEDAHSFVVGRWTKTKLLDRHLKRPNMNADDEMMNPRLEWVLAHLEVWISVYKMVAFPYLPIRLHSWRYGEIIDENNNQSSHIETRLLAPLGLLARLIREVPSCLCLYRHVMSPWSDNTQSLVVMYVQISLITRQTDRTLFGICIRFSSVSCVRRCFVSPCL